VQAINKPARCPAALCCRTCRKSSFPDPAEYPTRSRRPILRQRHSAGFRGAIVHDARLLDRPTALMQGRYRTGACQRPDPGAFRAIMGISARAIQLPDRPQRAIRVTSVRMRRKDRTSISSQILSQTSAGPHRARRSLKYETSFCRYQCR
jgi:hypothetical protein